MYSDVSSVLVTSMSNAHRDETREVLSLRGQLLWHKCHLGPRAQPVKPHKHEDSSSVPRTWVKMLGMAVRTCNSSSGEADTGGSLGLVHW